MIVVSANPAQLNKTCPSFNLLSLVESATTVTVILPGNDFEISALLNFSSSAPVYSVKTNPASTSVEDSSIL